MFQDRRQHQRLTPNTPQLVLLDESKYSLLFDLCEGGLAIEGFAAQKPLEEFSVEFDLPEGSGCIQAKAEVVWTSESGYRTGFRFVDLANGHRQQLRTWIASGAPSAGSADAPSAGPTLVEDPVAEPLFPTETPAVSVESPQPKEPEKFQPVATLFPVAQASTVARVDTDEAPEALGESRIPSYWAGIILAVVMSLAAFLVGYFWRSSHARSRPTQAAAAGTAPKIAPSLPAVVAPQPPVRDAPSIGEPGFVLQVAAMQNEGNADALSATLQKQNFSAFVFKRTSDHLYRVVVGPFPKKEAAAQKQRDLEAQGFKPLLKPWSPE